MSDTDWSIVGMDTPNLNQELGPNGKAFVPSVQQQVGASLDGPVPQYAHHSQRSGMSGTKMEPERHMKRARQDKPMTHDQLMAKANQMLAEQKARTAQAMAQGPAVALEQDANGMALPAWLTTSGRGY